MTHKFYPMATEDRDGRLPVMEQYIVYTLALLQRDIGMHAVEIGTFYGETACNIARAMPQHIVITVDIPPNTEPKLPIPNDHERKYLWKTPVFPAEVKDRIEYVQVDSALLELQKGLEIGFAFIDGAHSKEYALNDFGKIEPLLVRGGIVVFHDVYGGVGDAVEELMAKHFKWQWSAYEGTSLCWGRKA